MYYQSKRNNIINIVIPIALAVVFALVVVLSGIWFLTKPITSEPQVQIVLNESGIPKFIDGAFYDGKVHDENSLYNALDTQKELFQMGNPREALRVLDTSVAGGTTFYRMQQTYQDVPVLGQQLVVSVDKNGEVLGLAGDFIPDIDVSVSESVPLVAAETTAMQFAGADAMVLDTQKYIQADLQSAELVYVIDVIGADGAFSVVVDAQTGAVLDCASLIENAAYSYTGEGLDGNQHQVTLESYQQLGLVTRYRFVDPNRNIEIRDADDIDVVSAILLSYTGVLDQWAMSGEITDGRFVYNSDSAYDQETVKNAVTTMKYVGEVYDYYHNVLSRNSYDGKGSRINVNININEAMLSSDDYANASWSPPNKQMYIGAHEGISFSSEKVVLAHEFTHGVVQFTANFKSPTKKAQKFTANETGALNEAYADILGVLSTNSAFRIGESQVIYESVGRDFSDPTLFNKPAQKDGEHYYPTAYLNGRSIEQFLNDNGWETLYDYDKGGVHRNATVPSHAAYLMHKGGAFKNRDEMAKVWYQSLCSLFPSAKFEDCALAVLKAAKDLGLSEASQKIIRDAFIHTRMLDETNFKLGGRVTDSKNRSLDRVVVRAIHQKNPAIAYVAYTNQLGMYGFDDLPRGLYKIEFQKEKFQTKTVSYTADADNLALNVKLDAASQQGSSATQVMDAAGFREAIAETVLVMKNRKRAFKMTTKESSVYEYLPSFNGTATRIYESSGDVEYYKEWGYLAGINMGLEQQYVVSSGSEFICYRNEGEIKNDQEVWESTWSVSQNSYGLKSERESSAGDLESIHDKFDWFELRNGSYYLKAEHFQDYAAGVPQSLAQVQEVQISFKDNKVYTFAFRVVIVFGATMSYENTYEYAVAPRTIPSAALAAGS